MLTSSCPIKSLAVNGLTFSSANAPMFGEAFAKTESGGRRVLLVLGEQRRVIRPKRHHQTFQSRLVTERGANRSAIAPFNNGGSWVKCEARQGGPPNLHEDYHSPRHRANVQPPFISTTISSLFPLFP